jgi:quercetin dioxygenase-like cupin family protein
MREAFDAGMVLRDDVFVTTELCPRSDRRPAWVHPRAHVAAGHAVAGSAGMYNWVMRKNALTTCVTAVGGLAFGASVVATALAQARSESANTKELSRLTTTIAGEPLAYPNTPEPVVSSYVETIPPGGVTSWMTHPVPAYLYVLEGTLTVEFADGTRHRFDAGQDLLQCHTTWHRGRNEGTTPMRFLAVFMGAKGVPEILHPPNEQKPAE